MRRLSCIYTYEEELKFLNFLKELNKMSKAQNKSAKDLMKELKDSPFPSIQPIESSLLIDESPEDIQRLEGLLKLVKQVGDESYKLVKDSIDSPHFEEAEIEFDEKEFNAAKSVWRSITSGWSNWGYRTHNAGVYIDFCERKDKVLVKVIKLDIEKSLKEVAHNLNQIGADCEKVLESMNSIDLDEIHKTVTLEHTVFKNLFK